MDKNINPSIPKGVFSLSISNNYYLIRFICLILLLLFVFFISAEFTLWRIKKLGSTFKISFTSNGATVIIDPNDKLNAIFMLPASARWTNTGIYLKPGEKLKITASGKIHTAIHHLVDCAIRDIKPPYIWRSPDGEPWSNLASLDALRRNLLIIPKANIGVLIGYLHIPGNPEPCIFNPRPEGMVIIGKEGYINNHNKVDAELWFNINETILDPNNLEYSKKAYVGSGDKKEWLKRWDYIVENDYWDLWWDDNIGYFLIQMQEVENDK